jgi:hypothetical protein
VIKPEEMLKKTMAMAKSIDQVKSGYVAVGLPVEKASSKVYKNGETVVSVGAVHEYGAAGMTKRSFLRMPFIVKKGTLDKVTALQFQEVFENGKGISQALGLIGTAAVNVVQEAFTTRGFGQWPDISQMTKDRKGGSSQVLIDTGILRGSITYVVRGL